MGSPIRLELIPRGPQPGMLPLQQGLHMEEGMGFEPMTYTGVADQRVEPSFATLPN